MGKQKTSNSHSCTILWRCLYNDIHGVIQS